MGKPPPKNQGRALNPLKFRLYTKCQTKSLGCKKESEALIWAGRVATQQANIGSNPIFSGERTEKGWVYSGQTPQSVILSCVRGLLSRLTGIGSFQHAKEEDENCKEDVESMCPTAVQSVYDSALSWV